MTTKVEQDRVSRRLLALLSLPNAIGHLERDTLIVSVPSKGISLSKGFVPAIAAHILVQRGMAEWQGYCGTSQVLKLKPYSDPALRQGIRQGMREALETDLAPEPDKFRKQHMGVKIREIKFGKDKINVNFNEAESPLMWMWRRKGRDGLPMISLSCFMAGERLRKDYTLANMTPRVTANWSESVSSSKGAGNAMAGFSDTVIAARSRFNTALTECGPEFSGVLTDLCCFLKGLEQIEFEHDWPARSGKVVVKMALAKLSRHYGLVSENDGYTYATELSEQAQLNQ